MKLQATVIKSVLFATSLVIAASSSATTGNGVERAIVNFSDFNLPASVKERITAEMGSACPSLHFEVASLVVKKDVVDQGVVDYVYDVKFAVVEGNETAELVLKKWSVSNPAIDPFTTVGAVMPASCN